MTDGSRSANDDTARIVRFLLIKAAIFILLPALASVLAVFLLL